MQHRGEHTRNGRPDKARTRRVSAAAPHLFFFLFLSASALLPQEDAAAQHRKVSAAFYNVENLFDTISSPFRNDSDFTPSGRYRWDAERYRTKLSRIARTIDDAGFDIVALAEVESERAVRDLTATLADDYNFIHRTTSDRRGIDIALLYKGDKFFPSEVSQIPSGTSREFLFVRGDLIGHETGLLVCHLPSKFNDKSYRTRAAVRLAAVADSLLCKAGCERLLVMGDFNGELHEPTFRKAFGRGRNGAYAEGKFRNALHECARGGLGSYCCNGQWLLYDNILVSESLAGDKGLHITQAGVFVRKYLLTGDGADTPSRERRGYPFRTFSGARYLGGYSDHLPVFVILSR